MQQIPRVEFEMRLKIFIKMKTQLNAFV